MRCVVCILYVTLVFVMVELSCLTANAQTISGIKFSVKGTETSVQFVGPQNSKSDFAPKVFMIGGAAPRIVADFVRAETTLEGREASGGQTLLEGGGHVETVRYAPRGGKGLRFVFDLKKGSNLNGVSTLDSFKVKGIDLAPVAVAAPVTASLNMRSRNIAACHRIPCPRLAPHIRTEAVVQQVPVDQMPQARASARTFPPTGPRYFSKDVPYPRLKSAKIITKARPKRRPVIVIDPGHGGRDPGAIGTRKTLEKEITFKASLELQKQLLKTGRYEVILTRSTDVYIEHAERLRIARAGGADLFISVHADSTHSKEARGASVYTLADRAKTRSKNIVSTQNWIMDVDLGEQSNSVGDILVDLAQRNTATQSDAFADVLLTELKGSTRLIGNSHRKAGYFVLLAPDVPAVLLELGFLSNPDDERLLKSASHRSKIVKSVTRAIDKYFKESMP